MIPSTLPIDLSSLAKARAPPPSTGVYCTINLSPLWTGRGPSWEIPHYLWSGSRKRPLLGDTTLPLIWEQEEVHLGDTTLPLIWEQEEAPPGNTTLHYLWPGNRKRHPLGDTTLPLIWEQEERGAFGGYYTTYWFITTTNSKRPSWGLLPLDQGTTGNRERPSWGILSLDQVTTGNRERPSWGVLPLDQVTTGNRERPSWGYYLLIKSPLETGRCLWGLLHYHLSSLSAQKWGEAPVGDTTHLISHNCRQEEDPLGSTIFWLSPLETERLLWGIPYSYWCSLEMGRRPGVYTTIYLSQ